jgi:hypothetical protein
MLESPEQEKGVAGAMQAYQEQMYHENQKHLIVKMTIARISNLL